MRWLLINLFFINSMIAINVPCLAQKVVDNSTGNIIRIKGTVRYLQFEGGFHGIIGEDGEKYKPMNLEPQFKVDGLKVKIRAQMVKGMAGIHMWGKSIEVLEVEKLECNNFRSK